MTVVSFLLCLVYVDVLTTTSCSKDDPVGTAPTADAAQLPDGVVATDGPAADTIASDSTLPDAEDDSPLADAPTDSNKSDGLLDAPVDTMISVDAGVDADFFPIDAMDIVDAPPFVVDAMDFVDAPPFLVDAPPDA